MSNSNLTSADYCHDPRGGYRQKDPTITQVYDAAYLEKYRLIDDKVRALSRKRLQVLGAFIPVGGRLLDYGCGTGRVVQEASLLGWNSWGYDLIPGEGRRIKYPLDQEWDVATFFDSLEHLRDPDETVATVDAQYVMVSVPWCHYPDNWEWFSTWRHYRVGEHVWYWNRESLDLLFQLLGYHPIMHSSFEDKFRPNPQQDEPNILSAIYERIR